MLANTVGMVVSYRGSRNWAFRDRPPRHADGGRMAFVVINLATMPLPIGCLWISRNVLGLDDPFSDNISANVIGLLLGLAARFYLFRTFVFRRPVHLPHLVAPAPRRTASPRQPGRGRRSASPQIGPRVAELGDQLAEQRQADARPRCGGRPRSR